MPSSTSPKLLALAALAAGALAPIAAAPATASAAAKPKVVDAIAYKAPGAGGGAIRLSFRTDRPLPRSGTTDAPGAGSVAGRVTYGGAITFGVGRSGGPRCYATSVRTVDGRIGSRLSVRHRETARVGTTHLLRLTLDAGAIAAHVKIVEKPANVRAAIGC